MNVLRCKVYGWRVGYFAKRGKDTADKFFASLESRFPGQASLSSRTGRGEYYPSVQFADFSTQKPATAEEREAACRLFLTDRWASCVRAYVNKRGHKGIHWTWVTMATRNGDDVFVRHGFAMEGNES